MNLGQLRAALQLRGYETDTAAAQTEVLNATYRRVCGEHHWEWLEAGAVSPAVAVGAVFVTFSTTDLIQPIAVRLTFPFNAPYTEQYNLIYIEPNDFRNRTAEDGENTVSAIRGRPLYWTHQGTPNTTGGMSVQFWPAADKAYGFNVDYIKDPPDLVSDTDTPIFPPTYHDILIYGALAEMAARERDYFMHQVWMGDYTQMLQRMKAQLGLQQQQTSVQVRRSGMYSNNYGYNTRS